MDSESSKIGLVELTAQLVSAYVARNSVPPAEVPSLLTSVHTALSRLGVVEEEPKAEELKPAVPIRKSITDDYLISLENGQRFKSLKRHLMTTYGMTPQHYREKWGLPKDYPMVAPAYAKSRSDLARSLGLGRKAASEMDAPEMSEADLSEPELSEPEEMPDAEPAPVRKAGRPKRPAVAAE